MMILRLLPRLLASCLSMIFFRKPVPTFRDHAPERSGRHLSGAPDGLVANDPGEMVTQRDETGLAAHVIATRSWQVDADDLLHPTRMRGHQDRAIGEVDRLVDVVGDKQCGLALLLPDLE